MKTARSSLALCALLVLVATLGSAQVVQDSAEAKQRLQWYEEHQSMAEKSPFNNVAWQFVGPMQMTGRMTDVEAHPSAPKTIYIAAAGGGVWKTTDESETWTPIFDNYPTASIGDLAIAPSDPNIVWVGTGEANILRSSMAGSGIYKSTNAGESFEYMGLADTQHIARILVHPTNPDIVYVASAGHEYNFSPDRGVYKTTDGGVTWRKVFFKNEETAAIDLAMDPSNPEILYLGTAERLRYRWNDPISSTNSGVWKSDDGGHNWMTLTKGLPDFSKGDCERVGLDVCRTQPNVVYCVVNKSGTANRRDGAYIYRSNDKGASWNLIEGNDAIRSVFPGYGWVFGQIRVDPNDPEKIYLMGMPFRGSDDGGKTWRNLRGSHVDFHGMWINPKDSTHHLVVNDGGLMISHDSFATHHHPTNIPIAQMFNGAISMAREKFHIYSNIQDHGSWRGEVDLSNGRNNIVRQAWEGAPGDEAGRQAIDPTNPDIVYAVTRYGGGPSRSDYSKMDVGARRPPSVNVAPDFGGERKRAQWVSPIIVSPHDNKRLLYGAQFVFLTDDQGNSWKRISDDLTNYNPSRQGNIAHAIIFAISESPLKKGLIYAGTDDGNVQVTQNEGASWTLVNDGIPENHTIANIEASHFDEGTVFITVNGKRCDDFNCYVMKSTDYGKTWKNIAGNIPGSIANVVKQDPKNKNVLYLGTDRAVYATIDGGENWQVLGKGLPTVYAQDLAIHTTENLAVIATHGRGSWVLDLIPFRRAARRR